MQTLYDYQEKPFEQVMQAMEEDGRALLCMATGLGKTAVSGHVARIYLNRGLRGLFLYSENEGLGQSENRFRDIVGNDISYKKFYGTKTKDWDADQAQMLFASFQSMNSVHGKWYTIFSPDHFDFIIVDEAHHAKADTYEEVLNHFTGKKLGMTGTPDREDNRDIRDIFGKEVSNVPLARGIARGWLKQVEYHTISDGINTRKLKRILREVKSGEKRITVKQLNETIFIQKRDRIQKDIIKSYNTIKEHSVKKRTLIFCENIDHAESFFRQFKNEEAGLIHSQQNPKINTENLKKFRKGELQYLLCIDKFNECIHVAGIEVIAFLRATDSKRIFLQQLGRGLAKSGIAEKVTVLDFVRNAHRLVLIRELAKQIREEVQKFDPDKKFDTNIFDLKGKYYDLNHVDTTINDILNILDAIDRGFYDTLEEASKAANMLNIKSRSEYQMRYKEDLRLPSSPSYQYSNFPGWPVFLGRRIHLESLPKNWSTPHILSQEIKGVGIDTIIAFAEDFRISNPEWFGDFDRRGVTSVGYHPDLIKIMIKKLTRESRPKGWKTINELSGSLKKYSYRSANKLINPYRKTNPNWFKMFLSGTNYSEHISPDLVKLVVDDANKRKPLSDWLNAAKLSKKKSFPNSLTLITQFAETFRPEHPDWFKKSYSGTAPSVYYHPELINLIAKHFAPPPKGWKTPRNIANSLESNDLTSVKRLAEKYKKAKPEWFKKFLVNSIFTTHYHPDLIKLIESALSERFVSPENWRTFNSLSNEFELISSKVIKAFIESYRSSHPGYFNFYMLGLYKEGKLIKIGGRKTEHYHPELVSRVRKYCKSLKFKEGWYSLQMLTRELGGGRERFVKFVEDYRKSKPNWFQVLNNGYGNYEHYHPNLVKLIKDKYEK